VECDWGGLNRRNSVGNEVRVEGQGRDYRPVRPEQAFSGPVWSMDFGWRGRVRRCAQEN